MPDDKIHIRVSEDDSVRHRGSRRKGSRGKTANKTQGNRLPLILGVNAAVAALLILLYFTLFRAAPVEPQQQASIPDSSVKPANSANNAVQSVKQTNAKQQDEPPAEAEPQSRETLVEDDGRTMWASPTAGPNISLEYLPAGSQILLFLRPSELLAQPEGAKVLAALGPWGRDAANQLRETTGVELANIESVLATPMVLDNGALSSALRVTFTKPLTSAELAQRLPRETAQPGGAKQPDGTEQTSGSESYLQVGDRVYWLPEKAGGSTLVICPQSIVGSLIDAGDQPALLVRDLQRLLDQTDADRTATLLVSPRFLDAGGSDLLVDSARRLRDAIDWLFGREGTAFSLSLNWDDDFFVELRSTPQLQMQPQRYSQKLRERIDAAPDKVELEILEANWHPYGRRVLARFPAMLRKLAGYTRSQVDERQALLRCYLPTIAGHNLLMASELLLTQPQSQGAVVVAAEVAKPQTVEERLEQVTTLVFPKDTLEAALEMLSDDIGVPIVILGRDLQLEGITKNQSFGIDLKNKPAGEILAQILQLANPDKTAESAADAKQKLVYVIRPAAGDAPMRIEVTTRSSAEKRGDKLPAVFTKVAE